MPFDRTTLLPIVRKLIADQQQTAFTRAIAAVQLSNLGGGKDDIPMIAAMASAPTRLSARQLPLLYSISTRKASIR